MNKKSSVRVAVVVVNWNGLEDTLLCIDSLSRSDYTNYSIIVVENGSDDQSTDVLTNLDSIILLKNNINKGFSGGVNTGIRYAISKNYDAIVLINNDAIVDTKWLGELVLASDKYSIVTSLLLNETGSNIDSTGEKYSYWGMPFPRLRNQTVNNTPKSGEVFGATGGATFYKTSLFKEIGLFDETFFAYYEDVDISFRAQLAGHKIYYTNKAIAYHKQGASSKKIPGFTVYQTFKNIPLLYAKNVPNALLIPIGVRLFLTYTLMFGHALKRGSGKYALKGWVQSVRYFWSHVLKERKKIQQSKVVSTAYIRSIIYPDLPPDQTGMRRFRKFFTGKD